MSNLSPLQTALANLQAKRNAEKAVNQAKAADEPKTELTFTPIDQVGEAREVAGKIRDFVLGFYTVTTPAKGKKPAKTVTHDAKVYSRTLRTPKEGPPSMEVDGEIKCKLEHFVGIASLMNDASKALSGGGVIEAPAEPQPKRKTG